jgi:hypothetical protein
MNESGTITLKIVAQDLASGNIGKAIAGIDKLAKQGGLVGSVMQGVGQSFGQMLNPVALVGNAIGMVTSVIGDSIGMASDQAEAMSKVTVVFGDQAGEIEAWASTAAKSMGMTKTAALESAGTLGNLFDSLGIAGEEAANLSKDITQLAADLGSFNNVSTDEVMTALQSGLLGESEPMRRFGSNLSAARVEAYALASGMVKTKKEITDTVKVQARYALMVKDTANAQGDFARTADGTANATRTLNSQIEDMQTNLGAIVKGVGDQFLGFLAGIVKIVSGPSGASQQIRTLSGTLLGLKSSAEGLVGESSPFARMAEDLKGWNEQLQNASVVADPTTFDWLQKLGPDTLRLFGDASADAMADVIGLARNVQDAGGDFGDFAAIVRQKVAPAFNVLTGAWTGTAEAVTESSSVTLKQLRLMARVTQRTLDRMNQTMAEAKEPWKAAWKNMAAWAKDPFRPNAFENWLGKRADKAVQKAKEAARNGKHGVAQNWLALAAVMKRPVLAALAETEEEIQALVAAMRTVMLVGRQTGTTIMGSERKVAGRAALYRPVAPTWWASGSRSCSSRTRTAPSSMGARCGAWVEA